MNTRIPHPQEMPIVHAPNVATGPLCPQLDFPDPATAYAHIGIQRTATTSAGNLTSFRARLNTERERQAIGLTTQALGNSNPYDFGDYNPHQPGMPGYYGAETNACFYAQPSPSQGPTQEAPVLAEAWKAVPSAELPLDNRPLRERLAAFAGKIAGSVASLFIP